MLPTLQREATESELAKYIVAQRPDLLLFKASPALWILFVSQMNNSKGPLGPQFRTKPCPGQVVSDGGERTPDWNCHSNSSAINYLVTLGKSLDGSLLF